MTIEQMCMEYPEQAKRSGYPEFSIRDIQFHVIYTYNLPLSYKQTRDALYRVRVRTRQIRHILRGVYQWELPQEKLS